MSGIAVFRPEVDSGISGSISFVSKSKSVFVSGVISGLKPGPHGIHIHQYGDLSDGCTSACAHWDPSGKNHHGLPTDPKDQRHAGDLGNIVANSKGIAHFQLSDNVIKLSGKNSIIGRSLIIHEDLDDGGKGGFPDSLITGHAGKRLACAIIGYSSK